MPCFFFPVVCLPSAVCLLPVCSFPVFHTHVGAGQFPGRAQGRVVRHQTHEHNPFLPVVFPTLPLIQLTYPLSLEFSSGCGSGDLLSNCEWCRGGQRWDWTLGPAPRIHVQGERRLAFVSGALGSLLFKDKTLSPGDLWPALSLLYAVAGV